MEPRGPHPPLGPGEVGNPAKRYLPLLAGNDDRDHVHHDEGIPQNLKMMIYGASEQPNHPHFHHQALMLKTVDYIKL